MSVMIWGVTSYIAKSNYLHHPILGLHKFPGGCMYKFTVYNTYRFTVYDGYVQFKINIFINNILQLTHVLAYLKLLILVIYDNVDVVCA